MKKLFFLFWLVSLAKPVYGYDIDAYCREVADAIGGSSQIEETCREQEQEARENLSSINTPARIKKYCRNVGAAVGGSYQIMETCVQSELGAKKRLSITPQDKHTIQKYANGSKRENFDASRAEKIFKGISYSIINYSESWHFKSVTDVRLEEKVSTDFLRDFALMLRGSEHKKHDRVFILYYLPDMVPGSGAWATSHFTPALEVRILGTTVKEEKALLGSINNSSGEIIGKWIDESIGSGAIYVFSKRNGKFFRSRKFTDGSGSEIEMIQKEHYGKFRFEEIVRTDFEEYYLIEKDGSLGVYDNTGESYKMRSIK